MGWLACVFALCMRAFAADDTDPGGLTGGFYGKEGDEPKTWQEDLQYMISVSHAEPALRNTFVHLARLAKRGSLRKVTSEYWYSLFSIPGGILGFRISKDPEQPGLCQNIVIGIHASSNEPPPLPFSVPGKVGSVSLLARKSIVKPGPEVAQEEETYFGEKCTAYVYGAGHWITRYFVRNDRIIAISFALEP
jgi:hypothetical protein